MRLLVLSIAASIACAGQTAPSCRYLASDVKPDDPFQFTMAFVESLSYAKTAFRPATESLANADAASQLSDLIFRMKAADLDYGCAAELLSGYQKSNTGMISITALSTVLAFRSLSDLEKESIALVKRTAVDAPDRISSADLAEQTADLRLRRENTWEELPMAIPGISFSLVSQTPDASGKLSSLVITARQRSAIMEKLEKTFGSTVKGGPKEGQDAVVATAAGLYIWISDKGWKTSDAK